MTRNWVAATLLVWRVGAQTVDVPLTNRDTRSMTVMPGSAPSLMAFPADPSPGGGDLFQIVLSKPAVVSLLLPDGTEITTTNAQQQGYTFTAVPNGSFDGVYLPTVLAVNGNQTLIQLPGSAPLGKYQIKVDASGADSTVLVLVSYFSSSPVRVGLLTNSPVYAVGDTIILSGFVFDGSQPLASAGATVRIVDAQDLAAAPPEVKLNDSGSFDAAPGDGIYTGTFKPTKAGTFTAALRATGTSNAGVPYSRTAATAFRVQPPLAKFLSIRDFAVDDDGDGIIDRVAVNAKINAVTEGKYQMVAALVTAGGARLQTRGIITLVKGENDVNLYFSGAEVTSLGEDGPFTMNDVLLLYQDHPEGPLADSRPNAGKTAAYAVRGRVNGIQASPARLDFGSVGNGSSKDLTVIIKNTGTTPLLEGVLPTNSTSFSATNPKPPLALAAGDQQTVTVRFAPTAAGSFSGRLVIAGVEIPLSGASVTGPAVDVSPATLDFGSVTTGQTKDLTFSVNNRGTANLVVSSVSSSERQFSITSPAGGFTVAPSANQTVTVRFTPAAAGAQSATINVASNDSTRPSISVAVTGTGSQGATSTPAIGVAPATLEFGSVSVSQTKDLVVTVSNTGNAPLSVSALTVGGSAFRVVSPAAPFTVAPAASQAVTLRFSPTTAGPQSGTLTVASNDTAKSSVSVGLSGTGAGAASGPAIEVTPASLEFGAVAVGQAKELSLTVRNNGTTRLDVASVSISNPRFAMASLSSAFSVNAASLQMVTIRFLPTAAGVQSGTITISSNDSSRPTVTVNVSGTGSAAVVAPSVLSVDDGSFEISTGVPEGVPAITFVNRLTPPSYPATLKNIQIAFLSRSDSLKEGDAIRVIVATNPSGGSAINNLQFLGSATRVGVTGLFSTYEAPALTIQSGDFIVGFVTVNPPNVFPAAVDTTPPSRQRSYVSLDGASFTLLDSVGGSAGNFGIRGVVETGAAVPNSTSTLDAVNLEFDAIPVRPRSTIELKDSLRGTPASPQPPFNLRK